ncbi:hypothetical protein V7182_24500 [Neobacillus drentensis]|uniref:hypothetical protein n=1 Tax=Neobacillus drentensis TaxID=220684 RepID=UPI002FFD7D2C
MNNLDSKNKCVIHLKRTSQYVNRLRKFKVYLNNEYAGDIGNGEEIVLPVEKGCYQIYVQVDWVKSEIYKFNIETGKEVHLLCGSPLKGAKLFIPIFPLFLIKQLFIKEVPSV